MVAVNCHNKSLNPKLKFRVVLQLYDPTTLNKFKSYDYCLKFIIIGDSFVGKRKLCSSYLKRNYLNGAEFPVKIISINNVRLLLQLWHAHGMEECRTVIKACYRNAHAALLCYDVTNYESIQNIKFWNNECNQYAPTFVDKIMVGNKVLLYRKG